VLVLILVSLLLVVASDGLHAALLDAFALAEPVIAGRPLLGAVVFVLLAALSAMLAFFSSAVLVPVAVQAWGTVTSALLLWLGWLFGGAAAYGVSRFLGRPLIDRLMPADLLARFENRISRDTPFGVVLLFQVALPSEVPGYVLGLVRYGFGRYLLALALAEIPFVVGTVLISVSLIERQILVLLSLGAVAVLLSAGALLLFRRIQL
jgi:uncharacterized membrane protein YdjX (TVP38/TMEM64 family)